MKYQTLNDVSRVVLVHKQQLMVDTQSCLKLLSVQELAKIIDNATLTSQEFYCIGEYELGEGEKILCYTTEMTSPDISIECEWLGLRALIDNISNEQYQLASRALQLQTYYQQHQFCGQCGRATEMDMNESALACKTCEIIYYPRISPCMMCLITQGEYCLLAHHDRHPDNLYATLAGFVEAGESIEQTVHREVREEVSLAVKNLSYFSSQSWPFPHQLMVGYFAEYAAGDIIVDGEEIIDAQWFHYTNLPEIPPPSTLSGQLIQAFVDKCMANKN